MTLLELQDIYRANCIHDGVLYDFRNRPGVYEAHMSGLAAVQRALSSLRETDGAFTYKSYDDQPGAWVVYDSKGDVVLPETVVSMLNALCSGDGRND